VFRGKHQYFRSVKTRGERRDRLVVEPLRNPDSLLQGRVYCGMAKTGVYHTTREIPPVPLPHLVHSIKRYVEHWPNIIEVFLSVKVVWYHDLVACSPKASGSLRSAHGRKDTLSKNTKCYICILMIFRPFVISSGLHLYLIALFRIKCKSNASTLYDIATILLVQGRCSHR